MVQVGDAIPSIELVEGNPGGKVNLATELASGPGLIIGVPAAFSTSTSNCPFLGFLHRFQHRKETPPSWRKSFPAKQCSPHTPHPRRYPCIHEHKAANPADHSPGPACSDSHIPGYINHPKLSSAGKVFVVSVNDAFVYAPPFLSFPFLPCPTTRTPTN